MPKTATIEQLVRRSGNREGSGYGGVTAEADVVPENKRVCSMIVQLLSLVSSARVQCHAIHYSCIIRWCRLFSSVSVSVSFFEHITIPPLSFRSKHEYTMNYHLYFVVLGFQLAFTTVLVIAGLVYVLIQTDWLTFRA